MNAGFAKTALICAGPFLISFELAHAHSGGVDQNGCHSGSQPYHCHRPSTAEQSTASTHDGRVQSGQVVRGTISHVRDGDTFILTDVPIRLAAVDCPETDTAAGQEAKLFLSGFLNSTATCELTGATTYDRAVGYCSVNGNDIGQLLFEHTQCRMWERYDVWGRY